MEDSGFVEKVNTAILQVIQKGYAKVLRIYDMRCGDFFVWRVLECRLLDLYYQLMITRCGHFLLRLSKLCVYGARSFAVGLLQRDGAL